MPNSPSSGPPNRSAAPLPAPRPKELSGGRVNQKWRTRTALLQAAADLLDEGRFPTIAETADAARMSRATAYRYFPNQERLLLEATNQRSVVPALEEIAAKIPDSSDTAERLDALVRAFQQVVVEHEPALRTLLRLTLEPANEGGGAEGLRSRGQYRSYWIDRVLEPLDGQLDADTRTKLVAALSLCMGLEAQLVLRDLHGLSPKKAEEICRWAASAVLRTCLQEVANAES